MERNYGKEMESGKGKTKKAAQDYEDKNTEKLY